MVVELANSAKSNLRPGEVGLADSWTCFCFDCFREIFRLINSVNPIDETSRLWSIIVQSHVNLLAHHITIVIKQITTTGSRNAKFPYSKSTSLNVTMSVATASAKPNMSARSIPASMEIRLTSTEAMVNSPSTHPRRAECGPR